MENKVEFKSLPIYFSKEFLGVKNWTIREVDSNDQRFKLLTKWMLDKSYILNPKFIIIRKKGQEEFFFMKKITDISLILLKDGKNLMGVTWQSQ
jgi:hypothetical protein